MYIHTPLILSPNFDRPVFLKLENVQPAGSFKARGLTKVVEQALASSKDPNFFCSSGGNAGVAAAEAAQSAGRPCIVVVPTTASAKMIAKIEKLGAKVIVSGSIWPEADAHLQTLMADDPNPVYVHPFNGETVWQGHSTLVDELVEQLDGKKPEAIVLCVGGGGLYTGVMTGLERHGWLDVPVYAIETEKANCFHQTVNAGHTLVTEAPTSIAKCLGSTWVPEKALEYYNKSNTTSVLVTDEEAVAATRRFANDHGYIVEPACGATLASLYFNKVPGNGTVAAIVCGGSAWGWEDLADPPQ